MGSDFGLRVSPRLAHSPVWTVSPAAFRLWVYLAMKGAHAPFTRRLADGQSVTVKRGQVLTSARALRRDLHRSLNAILRDLKELLRVGALESTTIEGRYRNDNGGVAESVTGGCYRNGNAKPAMGSLLTVRGINELAEGGVIESITKRTREATSSPLTVRDLAEIEHFERVMAKEGR